MLTFLTSLRHPLNSQNFGVVEKLFETSLKSVCGQRHDDFRVVVTCNSLPRITFSDPRVIYHTVDFSPPSALRCAQTGMNVVLRDKGTKLMAGLLLARQFNPEYIFIFDADDLVSNRLAEYAHARPGTPGWYVDAGYTLNCQTARVQRKHGMVRYCGTTLMPSARELLRLSRANPKLDENSSQEELLAETAPGFVEHIMGDHPHVVSYFRNRGLRMRPLPFRAAAWVLATGENHTGATLSKGYVPASAAFCREFSYDATISAPQAVSLRDTYLEWLQCVRSKLGARMADMRGHRPLPAVLQSADVAESC